MINSHESEKILDELCKPYSGRNITYWDCGFYFTETGYVLSCPQKWKHKDLEVILEKYFNIILSNRQIDFELILYYAYHLIDNHPSISAILSRLFSFILVDEYQDTKQIQYSIIASILKAGQGTTKTFIVGDPNQAIYQSLGGYPITAADFQVMACIQLTELALSKNYRSSERIVEYFGNYNVHETIIEAASDDKAYPSLISFNDTIPNSELKSELIRLIRFNIETLGDSAALGLCCRPLVDSSCKHDSKPGRQHA